MKLERHSKIVALIGKYEIEKMCIRDRKNGEPNG